MERTIVFKSRPMQVVEARIGQSLEEFIRERYEAGKTQREIATELGVTDGTISRWMVQLGIEARFPGPRRAEA